MLSGKGHVGEHVMLSAIHDIGHLRHLRPDLVGDIAPLVLAASGVSWAKAVAMKADTTRRPLFPALARALRTKWKTAPLPSGGEHLRRGCLDTLVRIGDGQLHAPQAHQWYPSGWL